MDFNYSICFQNIIYQKEKSICRARQNMHVCMHYMFNNNVITVTFLGQFKHLRNLTNLAWIKYHQKSEPESDLKPI